LVLLGVIMSLPDLATKVEKHPKYRRWFSATCLAAGLIGFVFDVTERRSSDQTNRQLLQDTRATLIKTDDLINKTDRLTVLLPEVAAANQSLADLNSELRAAEGKNDPKLVASLQSKLTEAQNLADEKARELADALKRFNPQVVPSPTPATSPPTVVALSPETQTLKEQGLQLAKDINDWIAVVSQDPRNHPAPATTQEEMQAEAKAQSDYAARLNSEWNAKFDGRPVRLFYQLHADQGRSFNLTCRSGGSDPSAILGYDKTCANLIERAATNLTDAEVRSWDNGVR